MMDQSATIAEELQLVVFRLGREEFGVDISQVREIIKMTQVTTIPNAPEFVEGVINLRGTITPVVDLRKALNIVAVSGNGGDVSASASDGESASASEAETLKAMRIVIVEQEHSIIGMVVDDVSEVMRMSTADVEANPAMTSEVSVDYIRGVGKLGDRLLILLDLDKVLSKHEITKLKEFKKGASGDV